ncbi:MAG: HAD hydrolase family protein [Candidatus Auribacterota bacterium]|jgi:YrbI family 3-deoxy-D-manno-octulosonate 8-phosphate phosphatase|nr:HAD hydrolase family protein [Candidatus Auribacterota bacterium]
MKSNGLLSQLRNIEMLVLDFDGVMTDNRVIVLQDGTEGVICNRSDGLGIAKIKQMGIPVIVISTETNPVVTARCNKLGLPCIQGCEHKLSALRIEAQKLGINLEQIAYLGNDVNDLECMQHVGFPACVNDAYPDVKKHSVFITRKNGGYGAVREFCDLLIEAKHE